MAIVGSTVGEVVRSISPRHRRYRRTLQSCGLDPVRLDRPVAEPGTDDVILCGCPRSGTALLTAALHQPPTMVTVMEPWDGLRLAPRPLFDSLRRELSTGELRRGRLDIGALEQHGEVRWQRDEGSPRPIASDTNTLLGVKWPTYWQYLPLLTTTRFVVTIRHPADVLDSFAAQPGRLHDGFEYDVAFNRSVNDELAAITSVPDRRMALYDRVHGTVLDHADRPNVHLVRYERWHREPDRVLAEISAFLDRDLMRTGVRITAPSSTTDQHRRHAIAGRSATAHDLGYR